MILGKTNITPFYSRCRNGTIPFKSDLNLNYSSRSSLSLLETLSGSNLNASIIPSCALFNGTDNTIARWGGIKSFMQNIEIEFKAKCTTSISTSVSYCFVTGATTDYISLRSNTSMRVTMGGTILTFAKPAGDLNWHIYKVRIIQGATTTVRCFIDGVESSTGVLDITGVKPFYFTRIGGVGVQVFHGQISYVKITETDTSTLLHHWELTGHGKYEYDLVGDNILVWAGTGTKYSFDSGASTYLLDNGWERWSLVGQPSEYVPYGSGKTYLKSLKYSKLRTFAGSATGYNLAPSLISFNPTASDNALLTIFDRSNVTIHSDASRSSAYYVSTNLTTKSQFHCSEFEYYYFETLFEDGYKHKVFALNNALASSNILQFYVYTTDKASGDLTKVENYFKSASWIKSMAESYYEINSHYNFSSTQKAMILSRLSEAYISTTFGIAGLYKRVCDFFIFFENTSTEALTERTNTKTGDALRWNYGGINIYSQNNLPAQIPDGVISVTSTDGFSGITILDLHTNLFKGHVFNYSYLALNIVTFTFEDNDFDGNLPYISNLDSLQNLRGYYNNITGKLKSERNLTNIRILDFMNTGISDIEVLNLGINIDILRFANCRIPSDRIDSLLSQMNAYYSVFPPTKNTDMYFTGLTNGYISDTNADYLNMLSVWIAAGYELTTYFNTNPGSFNKGKVSFTFDDVALSVHDVGIPLFAAKGVLGTVFVSSHYIDQPISYGEICCGWNEIKDFVNAGWTAGSHGNDHISYALLSEAQVIANVEASIADFIANDLEAPKHFAYPFGSHNATTKLVMEDYFDSARVVASQWYDMSVPGTYQAIGTAFDKYLIPVITLDGMTMDNLPDIKRYIDYANSNKVGLVFLTHGIAVTPSNQYSVSVEFLTAIIDYCQSNDVDVINMDAMIDLMV